MMNQLHWRSQMHDACCFGLGWHNLGGIYFRKIRQHLFRLIGAFKLMMQTNTSSCMFSDPLPKIFCLCKFMCISFCLLVGIVIIRLLSSKLKQFHLDPPQIWTKRSHPLAHAQHLFLYRMLALTRDMRCHFRAAWLALAAFMNKSWTGR